MNESPHDWLGGVPVLLACARLGSATAAAAELGVGTATVIRRLTHLEEVFGARLFDRTPSGLLPTVALARALPWAEQIDAGAAGLLRELQGLETRPAGTVRLALLPAVSAWFVAPAVPRLLAAYPELVLELQPASATVDLVRREADLALRAVRPESGDLVVQRLASTPLAVVAAPALLAATQPQTLLDLPYVAWDHTLAGTPESRWSAAVIPSARVVLRSSELETLLRAAQAGVGALVVGEPMAAVVGGLVRVPVPTPKMPEGPLWLVAHRALRPVPRIAAVWRWLEEEFARLAASGRLALP